MNVLRILVVSLIVSGCLGCGNDPKPPAAAPPPPFKPASDVLIENAAKNGARNRAPAGAAENAVAADKSPAEADSNEEMTDEDKPASVPAETADIDNPEAPPSVASDENGLDEPAATAEPGPPDPGTTAEKPAKTKSSKWLRGLGNALNRAASKTLGEAPKSTSPAAKQPAPDDDPFPDGEPDQEEPKEQESKE
ncbi:MAG TPA: hypothetical protein VND64_00480 [Pirellulales bacterium]|nr:hypothetical protein [Pirellulales bacterium]